jgi:hypothetical protein
MEGPGGTRSGRRHRGARRGLLAVAVVLAAASVAMTLAGGAGAIVAGAGFTTDNPGFVETTPTYVDQPYTDQACLNAGAHVTPAVNCNIYLDKRDVWANGGPAPPGGNSLSDGTYFFAVLVPGGQPDPNDGGAKVLSDQNVLGGVADPFLCGGTIATPNPLTGCGDAYTNRTFTVSGGDVTGYSGTHLTDDTYASTLGKMINLMPYDTTSNPGGVYIMALCQIDPLTYNPVSNPVDPHTCKYDAFKVRTAQPPTEPGKVQSCFSGVKYRDDDKLGTLSAGEVGLAGWKIDITYDPTPGSDPSDDGQTAPGSPVTTDADGAWSWCEPEHDEADGSTSYSFAEQQQAGWEQTGNKTDEGVYSGGVLSHSLTNFVYSVEVPNDTSDTADNLDFGNIPQGTVFGGKYYDANRNGKWDDGEVFIDGWKILQNATAFFTSGTGALDANGFLANFTRSGLDPGTYTFAEVPSGAGWTQTGNTVSNNQTFTTGGASALLGPSVTPAVAAFAYRVTIPNDQPSSVSKIYFGNVCSRTPGGLTLGFWSNKNGLALVDASDFEYLTALNLRNANGSARDFIDTLNKNKTALSSWLTGANATNMANMLSAQLAATVLDVRHGFTNGTIPVDGTTTVNDLITYANSLLANPIAAGTFAGQNGSVTVASSALRTEQDRVKTILDRINNGGSFFPPTPTTCLTPVFP